MAGASPGGELAGASGAAAGAVVLSPQPNPCVGDAIVSVSESQAVLGATPTFTRVFRAKLLRRVYVPTKKRLAKARPTCAKELEHVKQKLTLSKKCCKSSHCELRGLRSKDEFLSKVAQWRVSWKVTPRQAKRNTLLHHLHTLQSQQSKQSQQDSKQLPGEGHVTKHGGQRFKFLLRASFEHDFLGSYYMQQGLRDVDRGGSVQV